MSSIAGTDYDPEGQWADEYVRQLREEIEAAEDYDDPDYLWALEEDDVRDMCRCACCCCERAQSGRL